MISDISAFIKLLPLLYSLVKTIQAAVLKAEVDGRVSDHLVLVQQAFEKNDATILNNIFNNTK